MAGCLNGGSCLFDKEKDAFACSCNLQWSGEKCELGKFLVSFVPYNKYRIVKEVYCLLLLSTWYPEYQAGKNSRPLLTGEDVYCLKQNHIFVCIWQMFQWYKES